LPTLSGRIAAGDDGFRTLAPGVLTVIPADLALDDAIQRGELFEVTQGLAGLAWQPKWAPASATLVELARQQEFPRDVWCLEFAFKPPRSITVKVPGPGGPRETTVWYVIYRVRNVGGRRVEQSADDPVERTVESTEQPIRFLPHFVLESREGLGRDAGLSEYRGYLDRLIPSAVEAIRLREDPAQTFVDSAAMAAEPIQPGESRWGVATWEGVDPRIDFFSVYVRGLTNAIRWRQRPGSTVAAQDPPGQHTEQTLESLRLDFWRPGDERVTDGAQVRIGYRGMFERMALGSRLLTAVGWPGYAATRPVEGLERLKLAWSDPKLQEPVGTSGPSLLPLETVLAALAEQKDGELRVQAARDIFGDLGVKGMRELIDAAGGPADAERDATRRKALEPMGLTPEKVAADPVASLARIVRFLEESPSREERDRRAAACFGAAAGRIGLLSRAVIFARVLATLEELKVDPVALGRQDARGAVEMAAAAVGSTPANQHDAFVAALFGPEGSSLMAEALAVHEGIDHSWVFRYEKDG